MADTPGWSVRPYRAGDRDAILDLHQIVFGSRLTSEQWDWQFSSAPFGVEPVIWLAVSDDGAIIGHYSEVPVPLWRDSQAEMGAFSILSMIHPDFQRQGILRTLAEHARVSMQGSSIGTSIAFLNDNSYPVYTDRLGWQRLRPGVPIYVIVLDERQVLARYLRWRPLAWAARILAYPIVRLVFRGARHREGAGVAVTSATRFDGRVDALWERLRAHVSCATDRGHGYLNWRLVDCPRPYAIDVVEAGDDLRGIIVTRSELRYGMRVGYIVELLVDPGHPDVGDRLVARATARLRDEGCAMVTALAPVAGGVRSVLERGGFRRLPERLMPHGIHVCVIDRSQRGDRLASSTGWFLSWSDHDVA